jgi:hypothetical protein
MDRWIQVDMVGRGRGSNVHSKLSKTIYTLPYCTAKFREQSWYYMQEGS